VLDVGQAHLHLGNSLSAVGSEVDQVLLLLVQPGQLGLEMLDEQLRCFLLHTQQLVKLGADTVGDLDREVDGGVVLLNGFLDGIGGAVSRLAQVLLAANAEEVAVETSLALGLGENHP
jgi:hypothetical protein